MPISYRLSAFYYVKELVEEVEDRLDLFFEDDYQEALSDLNLVDTYERIFRYDGVRRKTGKTLAMKLEERLFQLLWAPYEKAMRALIR